MLLEMQHIEYRHKISRHKPVFHGTFCILKGIHFIMISFSSGLAFLSLSLPLFLRWTSSAFLGLLMILTGKPVGNLGEAGNNLSTIFMPRKIEPKILNKHPSHWLITQVLHDGWRGYKMTVRITRDPCNWRSNWSVKRKWEKFSARIIVSDVSQTMHCYTDFWKTLCTFHKWFHFCWSRLLLLSCIISVHPSLSENLYTITVYWMSAFCWELHIYFHVYHSCHFSIPSALHQGGTWGSEVDRPWPVLQSC